MIMWQTFTNSVRRAFTDAADQYDVLAGLHREIGRELVQKNARCEARRILDVGTGTGYIADKAKFFFPDSMIAGLDIAEGMIAKAAQTHEGIEWLQADGQALPFKDKTFDRIFSNLAYQWMPDLPLAFVQARRVLTDTGSLHGTLFGLRTCEELFASLAAVSSGLSVRRLLTPGDVQQILRAAGFADIHVDHELIKIQFKDIRELLGWLKAIGANHLPPASPAGGRGEFIGKEVLAKAGEHYRRHFPYGDGICASFEVIWFDGHK